MELIYNTRNLNKKRDLCSILDYTVTKNGLGKLRCNILQPPSDLVTIAERIEIIERMLSDNKIFEQFKEILQKFQGLDEIISFCQIMQQRTNFEIQSDSIKLTEYKIERILFMKHILKYMRELDLYIRNSNLDSLKNIFQVFLINLIKHSPRIIFIQF